MLSLMAVLALAGALHTLTTIDSARRRYLGAGGTWNGRKYGMRVS